MHRAVVIGKLRPSGKPTEPRRAEAGRRTSKMVIFSKSVKGWLELNAAFQSHSNDPSPALHFSKRKLSDRYAEG
jgi:hypothetical protein